MKVLRRQEVEAAHPPAYLTTPLTGINAYWLGLGVLADSSPTEVAISEYAPGGVAVDCKKPCPSETVAGGDDYYLVPVPLNRPLGNRLVYDGKYPVF